VVLPCVIENLPQDMHVIWQYGKRIEKSHLNTTNNNNNQILLTIGRTQIENNYRVRVVANSSSQSQSHVSTSTIISNLNSKISSNNLEIRKLQLSDSGWYECQLPTKPTQKNYVHLEVLSYPKIDVNIKHPRLGESLELKCQIKNLPSKYEMHWTFNDMRIVNQNGKYTILYHRAQNVSTSTLKLVNLDHMSKGVYKCKYDKVEAKYFLDFKGKF
jgi:hypothetical protein